MAKSKKSGLKLDLSAHNLLSCLFFAVVGILLLALRAGSLEILMTVAGVLLIILGIVDVFKDKDYLDGIVQIGIGVAIIVLGWLLVEILLLILGIVLVIKGVLDIVKNYKNGFLAILPALITIVVGIILIVTKWAWTIIDILCIIAGIIFLINAVLTLFGKKISLK